MISEFAKEKVFWTKKMNLRLVKFMEGKSNMWNPKHPKYTSVELRDRTYSEFASKYGNQFTGQAVKDRWTNIRTTFTHCLRKIQNSRLKSDGEEYKVNWHLWTPCQYLLKVTKGFQSGSVDYSNCDEDNIKNDTTQSRFEDQQFTSDDNVSENNSTSVRTSSLTCKSVAKNLVNVLKGVQNDSFGLDNTKNGKIGQTVTKSLCQMDSLEAAKAAQNIIDILLKYNENNPNNPNSLKVELLG